MENVSQKVKRSPEQLFNKFVEAEDCLQILHAFQRLTNALGIKAESPRDLYHALKSKLQSWKCKSLWELLDNRANLKEYDKGKICEGFQVLVIGAGPIGLRTAIELALLGAQVVIVEKRRNFSRNNVLHLWPFLLSDFRSLGAKRFYGKFCSGAINHISIRRLQATLLKTALIFGVQVFTGVTFENVIEPANEDEGWKCSVTPASHPLNQFELDVVIGADGKKNVLPGFAQIEMRGTLAIGITANFVNHCSEEEAIVEEISGIAYQFNPAFFDQLNQQKGIKLENIVYYKDETHYFVMTAVKSSLLARGVLKKDYGKDSYRLLSPDNIDQENLIAYVSDAVQYATKDQLKTLELKMTDKGRPDLAAFDFTSIKKAKNSARIRERKGSKLLVGLVGDSLLEPFWPTGSGCARGVLSALDAAWMVRSFAQDKPPLQILSERENIYRLLSGTANDNLHKNHVSYTINPATRYMHIPQRKLEEVYHLYDTDDPVNADFSLGSPTLYLGTKSVKRRRISTGAKPSFGKNRRRIKFSTQLSVESQHGNRINSSCSSMEDVSIQKSAKKRAPSKKAKVTRTQSEGLTSGGEEVYEIASKGKKVKKSKKGRTSLSPLADDVSEGRSTSRLKKFTSRKHKATRTKHSPNPEPDVDKTSRKRSFFGFGRARTKSKVGRKSPKSPKGHGDQRQASMERKLVQESNVASKTTGVESSSKYAGDFSRQESSKKDEVEPFNRNLGPRRSARDIIAEMEARSKSSSNNSDVKPEWIERRKVMRKSLTTGNLKEVDKPATENETRRASYKRATSDYEIHTPIKQAKQGQMWEEIASMSPSAERAVPVLSQMSPKPDIENSKPEHSVSAVVRMAAMLVMAAPLLIDDRRPKPKATGWLAKAGGRVRNAVSKYNSMNDVKPMLKNAERDTPLRHPLDRKDGPQFSGATYETEDGPPTAEEKPTEDQTPSRHEEPTGIAFFEGKSVPNIGETPEEKDQTFLRQDIGRKLRDLSEQLVPLDQESTDSPVKKELNSKLNQKTLLAMVKEKQDVEENRDQMPKDTPGKYTKEKSGNRETPKSESPAIKKMEKLMESLTESTSKERAEASIRFLTSLFRRIKKYPKDDKFRRIFKSRLKFKKFVWTVRNAKLFMFASGWVEVGSFLLFPLTQTVDEPLQVLTKYHGSLGGSPSLLKSVTTSRLGRISKSSTGSQASTSEKEPKPRKTRDRKQELDMETSRRNVLGTAVETPANERNKREEVLLTPKSSEVENTPLNSASEMHDITWDLEMEDPLAEASWVINAFKGNGRVNVTSSEAADVKLDRTLTFTPSKVTPVKLLPLSPDPAIMEEINSLSSTLDDLMQSLDELDDVESDKESNKKSENVKTEDEVKSLYTTLDYLLDGSEEEELARDFDGWQSEPSVNQSTTSETPKSAFTRVAGITSSREALQIQEKNNRAEITELESRGPLIGTTKEVNGRKDDDDEKKAQHTKDTVLDKCGSVSSLGRSKNKIEKTKALPQNKSLRQSPAAAGVLVNPDGISTRNSRNHSPLGRSSSLAHATEEQQKTASRIKKGNEKASGTKRTVIRRDSSGRSSSASRKSTKSLKDDATKTASTTSQRLPSNSKEEKRKNATRKKGGTTRTLPPLSKMEKSTLVERKGNTETVRESTQSEQVSTSLDCNTGQSGSFKKMESETTKVALKARTQQPYETRSKYRGILRQRPPSGSSQSRDERAKRRNEIAAKLEALESGYAALEKSPLKKTNSGKFKSKATRTISNSSVDSNASSRSSINSTRSTNRRRLPFLQSRDFGNSTKGPRSHALPESDEDSQDERREKMSGKQTKKELLVSNSVGLNIRIRTKANSAPNIPNSRSSRIKDRRGSQTSDGEKEIQTRSNSIGDRSSLRRKRGKAEVVQGSSATKETVVTQMKRTVSCGIENDKKTKVSPFKLNSKDKDNELNGDTQERSTGNLGCEGSADDSFDAITLVDKRGLEFMVDVDKEGPNPAMNHQENDSQKILTSRDQASTVIDLKTVENVPMFNEVDDAENNSKAESDNEEQWTMGFAMKETGSWTSLSPKDPNIESNTFGRNSDIIRGSKFSQQDDNNEISCSGNETKETIKNGFDLGSNNLESQFPKDHNREREGNVDVNTLNIKDDVIADLQLVREDEGQNCLKRDEYGLTQDTSLLDYAKNDGRRRVINGKANGVLHETNNEGRSLQENEATLTKKSEDLIERVDGGPCVNGITPRTISNGLKHRTYRPLSLEQRRNVILEAAETPSKKKTKQVNERRSILRLRSQSAENLVWGKKKNFEEGDFRGRTTTLDIPLAKEQKKRGRFPFNLRSKKGSGSCTDLQSKTEESPKADNFPADIPNAVEMVLTPPPSEETEGSPGSNEFIIRDLTLSSTPEKSPRKKKRSPFRIHLRKNKGSYDS